MSPALSTALAVAGCDFYPRGRGAQGAQVGWHGAARVLLLLQAKGAGSTLSYHLY